MSDDSDRELGEAVIALLIWLLLAIPLMLYTGWVASHLWRWFITPVFGAEVPSVPLLAGVLGCIRYATWTITPQDKRGPLAILGGGIFLTIALGLTSLLFGWVLHWIAS